MVWGFTVGHTKDLKNGTCDLSSLVLGVDGWVQGNSSTSAAFTLKAATWPKVQESGDGCRPLADKEYKSEYNETELNSRPFLEVLFVTKKLQI